MMDIKEIAKWMESEGIAFISQDGNFITVGWFNDKGQVDSEVDDLIVEETLLM